MKEKTDVIIIHKPFILVFFFHFTIPSTNRNVITRYKKACTYLYASYFLQMCCKVVQPSALLVVFETLLSSAATIVDEEKGNPSWQACADFYIVCILSCLPWGGSELIEVVFFLMYLFLFKKSALYLCKKHIFL